MVFGKDTIYYADNHTFLCVVSSVIVRFLEGSIKWHTDGSKTRKGTGTGVFVPKTKYSERGIYHTIAQADINTIGRFAERNLDNLGSKPLQFSPTIKQP